MLFGKMKDYRKRKKYGKISENFFSWRDLRPKLGFISFGPNVTISELTSRPTKSRVLSVKIQGLEFPLDLNGV